MIQAGLVDSLFNTFYCAIGYPIFAWKGMKEEDFWWCIEQCLQAPSWQPNMVCVHVAYVKYILCVD